MGLQNITKKNVATGTPGDGDVVSEKGKLFIPKMQISKLKITVEGITSLIVHRFSEKARKQMLDKQMKKAKAGKDAKDPERDFREACYVKDGKHLFPVIAFKAAAVTACTSVDGIKKTEARQAFHVSGFGRNDDFVEIIGPEPKMREDVVKIAMGTTDLRFRPEYMPWSAEILVRYNVNTLSPEQIINLFNTAGFGVGVGEWRPERDGAFGQFSVKAFEDVGA